MDITTDEERVVRDAAIYGRYNESAVLTDYQKVVNAAAGRIALDKQSLLLNRGIVRN